MQIEELIGRRIQALRKTMKDGEIVTQEDLGERMGTYLEKPWSRQAVSAAEKGQRSFTAVELAAFASIFEVPVQSLFQAPIDVVYLDMPSGVSVDVRNLRRGRGMVTEVGSRSKGGLDEVVEKFREAAAEMQGLVDVANQTRGVLTAGYEAALALEQSGDETTGSGS